MASRTPAQISQDILAKLAVTAPGLSLEVGTPERKIIDAVAEALSEGTVDNYVNSTALDIDTKSGADLEDYVGVFGFGRLQGNYSSGTVTVTFNTAAVQSYIINPGTQFFVSATSTSSTVTFNSTTTVAFNVGDNSAVVPLQCAIVGTVGNVSAGSIANFTSGQSFSTVTNIEPFSGGSDDETDEQLRARFKKTILRNITGTADFYTAICLQIASNGNSSSSGVSRVNIIGPVSKATTQIQTGSIGTPVTIPGKNISYVWPGGDSVSENAGQIPTVAANVVTTAGNTSITAPAGTFNNNITGSFVYGVGIPAGTTISYLSDTAATLSIAATSSGTISLTIAGETWFTNTVDYNFSSGFITSPTITPLNSAAANSFLDIGYEYNSTHSRNNPFAGISNKIDIFVDGFNPQAIQEQCVTSGTLITAAGNGDSYSASNFATYNGSAVSLVGKTFQRLGSTPILTWPISILTSSGSTTLLGTDYIGVYDTTTKQGSEREMSGIVWLNAVPANGLTFLANYTYNQTPQILNSIFKKQKQITTDVMVHQAIVGQFSFTFVIQYNQGYAPNNVNNDVIAAINNYFNTVPFGGWIQFSDMLQVAHNVNGVDNVRMAHAGDGGPLAGGVYQVNNGTAGTVYTSDFQLDDNALASLYVPTANGVPIYPSMFIRRSFNNFGS